MSHYNTGIGDSIPSVLDIGSAIAGVLGDFAQLILGNVHTSFEAAALSTNDSNTYDPETRSWAGPNGLRYRVPLLSVPSERHTREKTRNIKILMDNCRAICVNDELPSTPEERKFWTSYRFMKYQLIMGPFFVVAPPLYIFWKVFHNRMWRALQGRMMPILVSFAVSEQWAEVTYPGHRLLSTALTAKTPMGDAARAEWARLQPIDIPFYLFSAYQFQHFFDNVPKEYKFGGHLAAKCN